jgi:hypothetical protein
MGYQKVGHAPANLSRQGVLRLWCNKVSSEFPSHHFCSQLADAGAGVQDQILP